MMIFSLQNTVKFYLFSSYFTDYFPSINKKLTGEMETIYPCFRICYISVRKLLTMLLTFPFPEVMIVRRLVCFNVWMTMLPCPILSQLVNYIEVAIFLCSWILYWSVYIHVLYAECLVNAFDYYSWILSSAAMVSIKYDNLESN